MPITLITTSIRPRHTNMVCQAMVISGRFSILVRAGTSTLGEVMVTCKEEEMGLVTMTMMRMFSGRVLASKLKSDEYVLVLIVRMFV